MEVEAFRRWKFRRSLLTEADLLTDKQTVRFGRGGCSKATTTDILAYFDRPGTSNGPTGAINGRLEHLRGSALGVFRNLTNHVARSLLESVTTSSVSFFGTTRPSLAISEAIIVGSEL